MALMISHGGELIRYNPANSRIEYSTNSGRSWYMRYPGKDFIDITNAGKECLATTADGHLYYSTNQGRYWYRRK